MQALAILKWVTTFNISPTLFKHQSYWVSTFDKMPLALWCSFTFEDISPASGTGRGQRASAGEGQQSRDCSSTLLPHLTFCPDNARSTSLNIIIVTWFINSPENIFSDQCWNGDRSNKWQRYPNNEENSNCWWTLQTLKN